MAESSFVQVLGDPAEEPARLDSVVLTWPLSLAPDASWSEDFVMSPLTYGGPGALEFLIIGPPKVVGSTIRWRVPAYLKEQAHRYIDQRMAHANH